MSDSDVDVNEIAKGKAYEVFCSYGKFEDLSRLSVVSAFNDAVKEVSRICRDVGFVDTWDCVTPAFVAWVMDEPADQWSSGSLMVRMIMGFANAYGIYALSSNLMAALHTSADEDDISFGCPYDSSSLSKSIGDVAKINEQSISFFGEVVGD